MTDNSALPTDSRRFCIGRGKKNDIVIDDPTRTVSSVHIELFQNDRGRWCFLDRSKNGTFVYRDNRWKKLKQGTVEPGERLSLGKYSMTVDWLLAKVQQLQEQAPKQATPAESAEDPMTRRTIHFERPPKTGKARRR